MSLGMYSLNKEIFNSFQKLYYSIKTLILNLKQLWNEKLWYIHLNRSRAFTHIIKQWTFVSLIHESYINMWSVMICWLSLPSCMQICFFANSAMLFNNDIMWSTRQYETILRMNMSREEPRYWHAKNPVKFTLLIAEVFRISSWTHTHIW